MQFRGEKINQLLFPVPTRGEARRWVMGTRGRSSWQTVAEGSRVDDGATEHGLWRFVCLWQHNPRHRVNGNYHALEANSWLSRQLHKGSLSHHFAFPFHPTESSFVHLGGKQVFSPAPVRADWVHLSVATLLFQTCSVSPFSPHPCYFLLLCCKPVVEALGLFWLGQEKITWAEKGSQGQPKYRSRWERYMRPCLCTISKSASFGTLILRSLWGNLAVSSPWLAIGECWFPLLTGEPTKMQGNIRRINALIVLFS